MNLRDKIQKDAHQALKKQASSKLTTLRFLQSQVQNKEIAKGRKELTDEEVIALINTQIKKLKESLVLFEKGKREDLVSQAKAEIKILTSYLPQQLSDQELEKEVEKVIRQNPTITNQGALIGLCVKTLAGRADNKKIAQAVIKKFQGKN